jgi:hypothetical protein
MVPKPHACSFKAVIHIYSRKSFKQVTVYWLSCSEFRSMIFILIIKHPLHAYMYVSKFSQDKKRYMIVQPRVFPASIYMSRTRGQN